MINRILLDMDGVLANFVGGVLDIFGLPQERRNDVLCWEVEELLRDELAPQSSIAEMRKEMWRRIDQQGQEWWETLEHFPWSNSLYDLCSANAELFICSTPPQHPAAIAGKLVWLQEWLGYDFRNYIFTPSKKTLAAGRDVVLIDDYNINVEKFKAAGGSSILFPQPWNAPGRIWKEVDRVAYVEARLDSL